MAELALGNLLKIYMLRHAQSVGNAKVEAVMAGNSLAETVDQGKAGALSPKGEDQAEALVDKLADVNPDHVIVSPISRARQTIEPWLKAKGRTGEIWPEVSEVIGQQPEAGAVVPETLPEGPPLVFDPPLSHAFVLRDDPTGQRDVPDNMSAVDGHRLVHQSVKRLVESYGGQDLKVLVVGHACSGARFIESLLGIPLKGRFWLENANMAVVEEIPSGSFVIRGVNTL